MSFTEQEKANLRKSVVDLKDSLEDNYWTLSQRLHVIQSTGVFAEWGYDDWPSYIDGEVGLNIRSVQYMTSIAGWFGEMDPEIQDWIKQIGWSKAKELVKIVTPANWKEYRAALAGKTVRQIQEYLASAKTGASEGKEGEEKTVDSAKKVSFKLFEEQLSVVNAALQHAKSDAQSDKDGNALTLICQDYLSSAKAQSLDERLKALEAGLGIKLVAFREGELLFGSENLDSILAGGDSEDE